MAKNQKQDKVFEQLKTSFLDFDPAHFVQNNLTLDGAEFSVLDNGWKFMADVYRYIALHAPRRDGKPVVIKKGRQVGATVMAGALDVFFTNSGLFNSPNIKVAHLFPALAHVKKFSQDKLETLIRTAKNDFINKNKLTKNKNKTISANAVDNLTMKQFESGTLWIDSIGSDGDRIRGMTIDVAFYDEVQDMFRQAIINSQKTLTAAKYGPIGKGVQVFFGTPKQKGAYFSTIWDMSDQRYYHLGCVNCHKTYPFYLPEDDRWKSIWLYENIIQCPLCGTKQKKVQAIELGKWVASKNSAECKYVGFHINQLYIPYITREVINDLMPENNPAQTERAWKNEVIGEFYSGAGSPLTKGEIYDLCRDPDRFFSKKINSREKSTYLGVDWGGKDDDPEAIGGQSFSCVVILSATPDGTLLVEHAHKLRKNSFSYKKDTIKEMYRRFGITRGVSDWFFGQDVVHDLQILYRDKFLGAQGSGSLLKPIKYREDELVVSYNKDLLIDELIDLFRKGKIRFPWKSYEYFEWLIDHCTSMESKIRISGGQPVKTFIKGSGPNDGFMALMYAYMAYKFDITKGFTVKPGLERRSDYPRSMLANVKRRI
jgi:predicted nucleic-acid-binding Zn-ribbon protein